MTDYYKKADKLLIDYQNNVPDGAEKLIEQFNGFLIKFSNIINLSIIDLSNRCTRGFISKFIKKEEFKKRMYQISRSPAGIVYAERAIDDIHDFFSAKYTKEEIEHIIIMTFLWCAKRYKPIDDNPRFHLYLLSCFHHRLYDNLMKGFINDTLNVCMIKENYNSIDDVENEYYTYDSYEFSNRAKLKVDSDIEIDDNWILGLNGTLFDSCTIFERSLLKMKFIDKYTDGEIAEKIGTSTKYVNEKKLALLKRIRKELINKRVLRS